MEQLERSKISSVLSYAQRIGFCAAKISKARATFRETMNYGRRKRAALTRIFWTEIEGCRRRTREHARASAAHRARLRKRPAEVVSIERVQGALDLVEQMDESERLGV
jgi:hypothetical protein